MAHPGKKLLFMGQDIAEFDEWNEKRSVEWNLLDYPGHRGVKELIKALHQLYHEQRALYELDDAPEGFEWINNIAANDCYLSFARKGRRQEDMLLVIANFSGIEEEITTGVPIPGKYKELLNTDAKAFDGSGMVNTKMISSKEQPCDDREESITVKMAPLSLTILQYVPFTKADLKRREEMKALLAAKEALRVQQEAEKEALEAAAKAEEHQKLLEKEMKEAKLAAKQAKESLEQAKKKTENAMHLVEEESLKLEGKKTKKVE
jgi:1,4-alpha-glucan branching enzyme